MKITLTNGKEQAVDGNTETILLGNDGERTSAITDSLGNLYTVVDRDAQGAIWERV